MEDVGGRARDSVSKERAIANRRAPTRQGPRPPVRARKTAHRRAGDSRVPRRRATGEPPESSAELATATRPPTSRLDARKWRGEAKNRRGSIQRGQLREARSTLPGMAAQSMAMPASARHASRMAVTVTVIPRTTPPPRQAPPVQQRPGGEQEQHDDDTEHDRSHAGPERLARPSPATRSTRRPPPASRRCRNESRTRQALSHTTLEPRADTHRNHRLRQRVRAARRYRGPRGRAAPAAPACPPAARCRPDRSTGGRERGGGPARRARGRRLRARRFGRRGARPAARSTRPVPETRRRASPPPRRRRPARRRAVRRTGGAPPAARAAPPAATSTRPPERRRRAVRADLQILDGRLHGQRHALACGGGVGPEPLVLEDPSAGADSGERAPGRRWRAARAHGR